MKESVHITYLFLFGASLATILTNFNKKNPNTGAPLMDYNLIMMTLPMVSSGSLIGVCTYAINLVCDKKFHF